MTINDAVIIAMIATIPPTITAIASLLASLRNYDRIGKLDRSINGRMGELLSTTKEAAHAAGKIEQALTDKQLAAAVLKEDKIRAEDREEEKGK